MRDMEIRRCKVREIESADNAADFFDEYANETHMEGLPPAQPQYEMYRAMENMGILIIVGAFSGPLLLGIINIVVAPNPHYGLNISTTESFFVPKKYRETGVGLNLLRMAEKISRESGSPGILISAPAKGQLAKVLAGMDYDVANTVFFKRHYDA